MNGSLTEEEENRCLDLATKMESTILSFPMLEHNIKVYRGVPLSVFKEYGVSSLEELNTLEGQYFFDSGFTSTSLIRKNSFFQQEIDWHEACNIEIEYLIPSESNDGISLISNALSYFICQTEYLLNKGNLSKILSVSIDSIEKKAYVKMLLIPKRIWDSTLDNRISNDTFLSK